MLKTPIARLYWDHTTILLTFLAKHYPMASENVKNENHDPQAEPNTTIIPQNRHRGRPPGPWNNMETQLQQLATALAQIQEWFDQILARQGNHPPNQDQAHPKQNNQERVDKSQNVVPSHGQSSASIG